MGRHMWGKTAGALVLAVTVAAASGCSSSDDEGSGKAAATATAAAKTPSVADTTATFQAAVTKFDTDGGCLDRAPGTCWEQMVALMEPARDLRKAMNAEKTVGAEFWTEAYALIDTMEKGIAVGDDKGLTVADEKMAAMLSNRDDVLGSAHDLADWLTAHPIA
ncbi:hypothetical protein ACFW5V_31405 [Streptomyces sp. NPDC058762]|uniref:hypothetical protein n=1 Tax=Streptomyces sp. NPDC058762 TaxID=3346629 RepID=UPI0036B4A540